MAGQRKSWFGIASKRCTNAVAGPVKFLAWVALALVGGTGEARCQTPAAADAKPVVQERDIVRVGQPWLRINTNGHQGTVHALAFTPDSKRLCSGGLDKIVQVWDISALRNAGRARDIRRTFFKERTIRWQVSRGPRGNIFALATAPSDGLLAMGGYGAMGMTGEILLLDPVDGTLQKVLDGHRQTICSLAFSEDGNWLVSQDTDGESRLWKRGEWKSSLLYAADSKTYGVEKAALIQKQPLLRPAVILGNSHVVLPVLISTKDSTLTWKLQQISLTDRRDIKTFDTVHRGLVAALATTADGKQLASADLAGKLYLWDLGAGGPPTPLEPGGIVRSLALSRDGRNLAAGVGGKEKQLQLWDVAQRKQIRTRTVVDHVHTCAFSPDGRDVAYVGGPQNEVFIEPLEAPNAQPTRLKGPARKIYKVAFPKEEPYYRVAFGTKLRKEGGGFNNLAEVNETYDPVRLELGRKGVPEQADWLATEWCAGNWKVTLEKDATQLNLFEGAAPRGKIQLDFQMQGQAHCYCWIPDAAGKPVAIAVGTDKQNSVYVYRLAVTGVCPLLRQFRGHQDFVSSVAVSRDARYLVSGSVDGTLQFWSLSALAEGVEISGRWGGGFKVEQGTLVVDSLNEAGPLFRKGLRKGDVVTNLRWNDGQKELKETDPQKLLVRLRDLPFNTQVLWEYTRGNLQPREFQLFPAWQTLATLFVSEDAEWAFWTPEGYYDASANGYTMFGWQINRGLNTLPLFYRADQFRRTLERPDVMRQLLAAGSLEEGFRQAKLVAPVDATRVLPSQIAMTPTVDILTPRPGQMIAQNSTKVRAKVTMPMTSTLTQTRVFANGVVASQRQLVDEREDNVNRVREFTYEWEAPLTNEQQSLIQVYAGTEANTAAFERVLVERPEAPANPERPKMYVLAIGVNDYQDPEIPDLDFPVADAESIVDVLKTKSNGLYEIMSPTLLTNGAVTRKKWQESFAELGQKLKETAKPDDVLLIFLAGHGEVDQEDQTYHYLCYDASLNTLLDGQGTISWKDFEVLGDVPCRKLALLDTCHSGAIQGVRQQHKLAIREFQENVIFTVAASADDESSQERSDWGHGAFTKGVLDAFAGGADESEDGIVGLHELVKYLQHTVPELTTQQQHPVAAPDEVLQFVTLPLAHSKAPAKSVPASE